MQIKLIDPRGEYGDLGIYGDIRYDLAKLLHSIHGYETILHNLYEIKNDKIIFSLSDKKLNCFKIAEELIYNYGYGNFIQKESLQLIEATMWLSNIPLHSDDKKRQQAFFIKGQSLLRELKINE
jgi:hypothetical protein